MNANLTTGERPLATDSDGDKIPDVHENLFCDYVVFISVDSKYLVMKRLDQENASDVFIDIDIDGLKSPKEYCWPYLAQYIDPSFTRGSTGITNQSGERWYLDPRVADTDVDGMPDGFEAHMCQKNCRFYSEQMRYECEFFNPSNASDIVLDPDEYGLDVYRDGFLSLSELLTSFEEYSYGAPSNWKSSILYDWPFILQNTNITLFENILAAYAHNATSGIIDE